MDSNGKGIKTFHLLSTSKEHFNFWNSLIVCTGFGHCFALLLSQYYQEGLLNKIALHSF